jgi:hypothetical protein
MNRKKTPFKSVLDHLEKKYSNFDGDAYEGEIYDYAEGSESVSQPKMYQADPYQIVVENTTTKALKSIIFGNDKFLLKITLVQQQELPFRLVNLGLNTLSYCNKLQQSLLQHNSCELNLQISYKSPSSLQFIKKMRMVTGFNDQ